MFERVIACTLLILTSAAAAARAQALTFTRLDRSTDPGARAIVAADFDGDGVIDLATASGTRNTVAILINARNAGGSFGVLHKYTVAAGPFAMAVADFNGDGSPDIVVAAADADRINVLLNHGDGTFVVSEVSAPGSPRGIAAGDIDHDGHVDLIYTSYSVDTVAVLFGDGTGQFHSTAVSATGHNPEQVAVADLDGDGELDLVVANSGISPLSVFYGNGTGGFRRVDLAGPKQLFAVTIGDFDGDGRPDVAAVSQASKSVAVYFNKITGLAYSMSLAVPASNARGIVAADFNKDGLADLAVAYRGSSEVAVIAATTGAGPFLPAVMLAAGTGSRALAAADYNGDGKIDLATANEYAPVVTVLTNRTTTPDEGAVAFELHALPSVSPDALPRGEALAAGDFNKNGTPDVVADDQVILDGTTPVTVVVDRPEATYIQTVVGDFNGDGNLDFARVARFFVPAPTARSGDAVDVFLGNGAGAFMAGPSSTFSSVRGLIAGDLNDDGRTDLVVLDHVSDATASPSDVRHVLLGQSDGTFEAIQTPVDAVLFSIGLADLDGDNR